MKNPDRDGQHRRRRQAGRDEDRPDGRAVAAALFGGETDALEDADEDDDPDLFDDRSHSPRRRKD